MAEEEQVISADIQDHSTTEDTSENVEIDSVAEDDVNENIPNDASMNVFDSTAEENPTVAFECSHDGNQTKTNEIESEEVRYARQSRELKSILALSKEAKLDTNIAHKRKSVEFTKSKTDRSESPLGKRAMRSQNPEFAMKQQKFLSKVVSHGGSSPSELSDGDKPAIQKISKKKSSSENQINSDDSQKIKMLKMLKIEPVKNKDVFCWRCHKTDVNIYCETCPRSYHPKCLKQSISNPSRWVCPECVAIMKAESTKERSPSMKDLSLEHLCGLLKFALKRMMQVAGGEPFLHPVNEKEFPEYKNYIIQPMDLTKLEKSIKENLYGSTQAFEADAKWILHNSMIFNTAHAKLTGIAKNILKVCKQEMLEIENCASCYLNANTKRDSWFVEVCPKPHLLVWAKLKGFPYWPAKAMRSNSLGMVDVRFFGAHDRAWVPDKECFLYSVKDPNCNKQKRNDIAECVKELEVHIENLKKVFGEFCYAPYRTPYLPDDEVNQLKMFLPQYNPNESHITIDYSFSTKVKTAESPKLPRAGNSKIEDCNESLDSSNCKNFEGYGSEDDDMEPKLDANRREQMAKSDACTSNESPSSVKQDDDFETQVNTSVGSEKTKPPESVPANSTVKAKTSPKHIIDISKKRTASEELFSETPTKKSRRNSDISVKSDSSRVSNFSDKINRVDIAENMEITLGNDNETVMMSISELASSDNCRESSPNKLSDYSESSNGSSNGENKRKRIVQLNISGNENAEFTISPQNKVSIADKLIKKFGQQIASSDDKKSDTTLTEKEEEKKKSEQSTTDKDCDSDGNLSRSSHKESASEDKNTEEISKNKESVPVETADEFNLECTEVVIENSKATEDNVTANSEDDSSHSDKNNVEEEIRSFLPNESDGESPLVSKSCDKSEESTSSEKTADNDDGIDDTDEGQSEVKETTSNKINDTYLKSIIQSSLNKNPASADSTTKVKVNETSDDKKDKQVVNTLKDKDKKATTNMNEPRKLKVISIKELQNKKIPFEVKKKTNSNQIEFHKGKTTTVRSEPTLKLGNNLLKPATEMSPDSVEKKSITTITNIPDNKVYERPGPACVKNLRKSEESKKSTENNGKTQPTQPIRTEKPQQVTGEFESITIKSEPSSSSEEEVEDIEAKRKYMSALNISEKDKIVTEKKSTEIRTRSKTEERTKMMNLLRVQENNEETSIKADKNKLKGSSKELARDLKSTDNLSRIINDVASHYSATHEKEEIRLPEKKKISTMKTSISSLQKTRFRKQPLSLTSTSPSSSVSSQNTHTAPRKSENTNVSANVIQTPKNVTIASCSCATSVNNTSTIGRTNLATSRSVLIPRIANDNIISTSATTTTTTNIVFVSQQPIINSLAILPPNQQIGYGSNVATPPLLTVVQPLNSSVNTCSTTTSIFSNICATTTSNATSSTSLRTNVNLHDSHNYIPPCGGGGASSNTNVVLPVMLNDPKAPQILNSIPSLAPLSSSYFYTFGQRRGDAGVGNTIVSSTAPATVTTASVADTAGSGAIADGPSTSSVSNNETERNGEDWDILPGLIPENLSQAVTDLVTRGVPKLKPRPPGPLTTQFDEGLPSTAGPVTAKVNSISHRLADYLRGMLVELLKDFGSVESVEAEIVRLRLENEELKQKHAEEMLEIKKNINSILKDIQRSIVEERVKLIEETRAACEVETIKRVEEAKSKQWCASCFKEAQFYCCWNTSYCDYPCQQKHWLKHMSKCTQNQQQLNQQVGSGVSSPRLPNQTFMLRPTNPIHRYPSTPRPPSEKTLVAKPTKVYVNRGNVKTTSHPMMKTSTSNGQLTLVESSPGNYELLGNGSLSVGGKILTNSTSLIQKMQKSNTTSNNVAFSMVPSSSLSFAVTPKLTTISTAQSKQTLTSTSSANPNLRSSHTLFSDDSD